jgi:lyso-ornithine lipid O-acyltransferase
MTGLEVLHATRHVGRGLFGALVEVGAARISPPRDPRDAAHRLAGAIGAVARAHDLAVTIHGDPPRGAALIVANHVSYLDPIAILPRCPAAPLAKSEVASWPVVGPIGSALGVVFVRRRDVHGRARALRRIHDLLAAGVPILNFPEGTTRRDGQVGPFYRGGFGIAQRLGVPVVPVAIRYRDPALAWCDGATFLPHYLWAAGRARIEVTLVFCSPLSPRTGESPEDYAARARAAIARALERTRWIDAGSRDQLSPTRPDPVLPARPGE